MVFVVLGRGISDGKARSFPHRGTSLALGLFIVLERNIAALLLSVSVSTNEGLLNRPGLTRDTKRPDLNLKARVVSSNLSSIINNAFFYRKCLFFFNQAPHVAILTILLFIFSFIFNPRADWKKIKPCCTTNKVSMLCSPRTFTGDHSK